METRGRAPWAMPPRRSHWGRPTVIMAWGAGWRLARPRSARGARPEFDRGSDGQQRGGDVPWMKRRFWNAPGLNLSELCARIPLASRYEKVTSRQQLFGRSDTL